jgi:hypothetical protein
MLTIPSYRVIAKIDQDLKLNKSLLVKIAARILSSQIPRLATCIERDLPGAILIEEIYPTHLWRSSKYPPYNKLLDAKLQGLYKNSNIDAFTIRQPCLFTILEECEE